MPPFPYLSDREIFGVIAYLKTFAPRWQSERPGAAVSISDPPARTPALETEGKAIYARVGCPGCHGAAGKGDGPAAAAFRYPNGKPLRPADFTHPNNLKGGTSPRDYYRTLVTGIDTTPMAAFAAGLPEPQRWALVYFLVALGEGKAP